MSRLFESPQNEHSPSTTAGPAPAARVARHRWALAETLWILGVFLLFAAGPPPDVNEAHYLGKAKNYWNPAWCAGDFFLESSDAHQVFYWTFGWLTLWLPLPVVAWVGRLITWTLLAWAWQRLSRAVVPQVGFALLSAALFLLFLRQFQMAGEWVIGGVEAKGGAYVLLLLALECLVRRRWQATFLLLGLASAFHVLVGGWATLAAGGAWLLTPRSERLPLVRLLPALVGGFVLSLPGLVPAAMLSLNVPPETVAAANHIYVHVRLPHHLVLRQFPLDLVLRHVALVVAWAALAWTLRRRPALGRLNRVVAMAVVIAGLGAVVDLIDRFDPVLGASLLRYYWFRLSDALVPIGAALSLTSLLAAAWASGHRLARPALVVAALAAVLHLADAVSERQGLLLPGAVVQTQDPRLPLPLNYARFHEWREVCQWIQQQTPEGAVFLTPRRQQTFKWYAQRAEVVTWKDVPQDAQSLVEWWRRYRELYPVGGWRPELGGHSDAALRDLGRKYGADYLLIDRRTSRPRQTLRRLWPTDDDMLRRFEVYALEEADDDSLARQ